MERAHREKQQQLELTNKAERIRRAGHLKGMKARVKTIHEEAEDNVSEGSSNRNLKAMQTTAQDNLELQPRIQVTAPREISQDYSGLWNLSQVPPDRRSPL